MIWKVIEDVMAENWVKRVMCKSEELRQRNATESFLSPDVS
jgi:hypothetical protein